MIFKKFLEGKLSQKVLKITAISGGDVNEVYTIETAENIFILKMNTCKNFPKMFEKEKAGLYRISNTGAKTPKVIEVYENLKHQFLLLEFIEEGHIKNNFWKLFAEDLVAIHKTTNSAFGLEYDNYIGSLNQKNTIKNTWKIFFIENRILPLMEQAFNKGLLDTNHIKLFEKLFLRLDDILPKEKPSLIHGDLWSGNLMNRNGMTPVFIDPAIHFGNREMDIAMTQMFGGFNDIYLQFYMDLFPLEQGWKKRLKIHNLYPGLVHLNLFGQSYLSSIERVIRQF